MAAGTNKPDCICGTPWSAIAQNIMVSSLHHAQQLHHTRIRRPPVLTRMCDHNHAASSVRTRARVHIGMVTRGMGARAHIGGPSPSKLHQRRTHAHSAQPLGRRAIGKNALAAINMGLSVMIVSLKHAPMMCVCVCGVCLVLQAGPALDGKLSSIDAIHPVRVAPCTTPNQHPQFSLSVVVQVPTRTGHVPRRQTASPSKSNQPVYKTTPGYVCVCACVCSRCPTSTLSIYHTSGTTAKRPAVAPRRRPPARSTSQPSHTQC